ncbi:hypothetical protein YC2023_081703 [Brassica napus]
MEEPETFKMPKKNFVSKDFVIVIKNVEKHLVVVEAEKLSILGKEKPIKSGSVIFHPTNKLLLSEKSWFPPYNIFHLLISQHSVHMNQGNAAAMYKIGLFYYFGLRGLRRCTGFRRRWRKESRVGRLLCLWDSHNIKKNDEFMGISLLLLDEQQQNFTLTTPFMLPKSLQTGKSSLTSHIKIMSWPRLNLCGAAAEVFPELIPWKEEKKEFVSIGELHTFIANSSEQVKLTLSTIFSTPMWLQNSNK